VSQEDDDYQKRNSMWGEYSDAYLDRGDTNDPEYWSPDRVANRERWRKGSNLLQDNVGRAEEIAAQSGQDADTALAGMGFRDQKDYGKYIFRLFNNQGFYANNGLGADPNLDWDWGSGRATWKAGTDNAGKSRAISSDERRLYNQAQDYRNKGVIGPGQIMNAVQFGKIADTHFAHGPGTSRYNVRNDGSVEWKDEFGRTIAAPKNFNPFTGGAGTPTPPTGNTTATTAQEVPFNISQLLGSGWGTGVRPQLKPQNNAAYGGWGATYGHSQTPTQRAGVRPPVAPVPDSAVPPPAGAPTTPSGPTAANSSYSESMSDVPGLTQQKKKPYVPGLSAVA
jgi:hypothetical protein